MSETKNSQYNEIDYDDFSDEEEKPYTFFEFLDEMTKDVDRDWETLTRYLRINGNKIETFAGPTEGGHYQNGIVITKYDNETYSMEEITSENYEIKLSSFSEFDADGNLISGYVNCFTLGSITIDKGYTQELFSGFIYNKNNTDNWKWDCIS